MLTASQLMVTRDERIRLTDGYNLEISELEPQDAGDYFMFVCRSSVLFHLLCKFCCCFQMQRGRFISICGVRVTKIFTCSHRFT